LLHQARELRGGDLETFAGMLQPPVRGGTGDGFARLRDAAELLLVQLGALPEGPAFQLLPYQVPIALPATESAEERSRPAACADGLEALLLNMRKERLE
jgi:hypothetical protein